MRVRRSLVKAADGDEAAPGWSDPEAVRPIGDEIEGVRQLLADLASAGLKSIPAAQHATRPERRPPAPKPIGELTPPPEPFSSTPWEPGQRFDGPDGRGLGAQERPALVGAGG